MFFFSWAKKKKSERSPSHKIHALWLMANPGHQRAVVLQGWIYSICSSNLFSRSQTDARPARNIEGAAYQRKLALLWYVSHRYIHQVHDRRSFKVFLTQRKNFSVVELCFFSGSDQVCPAGASSICDHSVSDLKSFFFHSSFKIHVSVSFHQWLFFFKSVHYLAAELWS